MRERLIGVDVGGTKVSTALLSDGRLSEPELKPTCRDDQDALLDQLVEAVRRAAGDEGADAVGVAVPSVVEWKTGRARFSVNVPLADVPVREVLRERLELPVFVDNDATCAALAEAHGAIEEERRAGDLAVRNLVMFTVGTGVGGGVIIDGRVFRGVTGAAPELGHWVIGADLEDGHPAHRDRFPQPGTLEALAAGRALDALAAERGFEDGRDCVRAAHDGDPAAREAIALLGRRLGIGIANAINAFDPEVVAIGGGASQAGDLLLEPAAEMARRYVLPGVGIETEIRLARSGPEAGVRGAALMAGQELALEQAGGREDETTAAAGQEAKR